MKRNLTVNHDRNTFLAPQVQKGVAKQFENEAAQMVKTMGKLYKSQVLGALHVSTVEKFADAQPGNYAKAFLKLSKSVQRKLLNRFSNTRIDAWVNKRLDQADKFNASALYAKISKAVGISATELAATEGMRATRNALIASTAEWIKKTRDDTLQYFTSNTLHAMSQGKGLDDVMSKFDDMVEKRADHARFVAQNQINNYNSIMTKTRAQEVGVTKAIWRTEEDDRVRESHADRDGKEFDLDAGLYSSVDGLDLLPQVDYNCRCDYELIIPKD